MTGIALDWILLQVYSFFFQNKIFDFVSSFISVLVLDLVWFQCCSSVLLVLFSVVTTYLPRVATLPPVRSLWSGVDSAVGILEARTMDDVAVIDLTVISVTHYPLTVWAGARLKHFWQWKTGSKQKGEITVSQ